MKEGAVRAVVYAVRSTACHCKMYKERVMNTRETCTYNYFYKVRKSNSIFMFLPNPRSSPQE